MKRYRVRYNVEAVEATAEQLKATGHGGCDRVLLVSVVESPSGSVSYCPLGFDPVNPENAMSSDDMFKCWAMLAHNLYVILPPGGRRDICGVVHEAMKQAILAVRAERESGEPDGDTGPLMT